ncbi:MATE efflux family protein 3, chloroplastic [Tetrabaena socialis]|uniref:MATE efflux family protein 3, chloroplastic n=1 Tax=Tetrabaena socialis TaxID=47790 RepID=A0A2J7ZVX9_9CHLO|nr:MATE efflux family protein 3, chloroplastic [Tetrabaena socialis]|eukprot:PNH04415.1 MATE efflux family protein 3, chloroplastic [Tetrabaena socialis]
MTTTTGPAIATRPALTGRPPFASPASALRSRFPRAPLLLRPASHPPAPRRPPPPSPPPRAGRVGAASGHGHAEHPPGRGDNEQCRDQDAASAGAATASSAAEALPAAAAAAAAAPPPGGDVSPYSDVRSLDREIFSIALPLSRSAPERTSRSPSCSPQSAGCRGFLVLRSASVSATYAVATTMVARSGAAVTASHQIAFQLWLACALLADALAVTAQSLMARDLGAGSAVGARQVAARVNGLGLGLGLLLAAGLAAAGLLAGLPRLFTTDPQVLQLVTGLFPLIALTQPVTILAMAWDGILYGVGGFRYAAFSMAFAALPAILVMQQGGGVYRAAMRAVGVAGGGAVEADPG